MTPLRVWYLDDEAHLLENFADLFGSKEIDIKTFSKPEELKALLERETPDLLLIDYRLPGTTGVQVVEQLSIKAPVYLISGELNLKNLGKCQGLLEKPFRFPAIEQLLKEYLQKKCSVTS